MYRPILLIICAYLVSIVLSGCLMTVPEECKFLPPTIKKYDSVTKELVLDEWPKDLFLSEWGKPDEVISVDKNEEIWAYYKKNQWCGMILPLPLLFKVCDEFDRITFKGDKATMRHAKVIVTSGFITLFPVVSTGQSFSSSSCYTGLFEKSFIDTTELVKPAIEIK